VHPCHDSGQTTENISHSRFLDLSLELSELGDGQLSVLVVVEALDEVQRSFLGVVELGTQYVHRLIESDEVAA